MDVILYIDNLAISTTEEELKNLFLQVGDVTSVKSIRTAQAGYPRAMPFCP